MQLRGQHGYAMAALLVGLSVAAVLMTAAMPVWKQMTRREREAELVFRGQQYARAIGLFQKRSGPGVLPPSIDVLVSGRFLRKKFKDPITNDDFDLLSPVQAAAPAGGGPAGGAQPPAQGRGGQPTTSAGAVIASQAGGRGTVGGIMGVVSKSTDASLRTYNGRTHYNEWQFIYVPQAQAPTAPGGAAGQGTGGTPQRGAAPPGGFGGFGGAGGQGTGRGQGRGQQPPGPNPGGFQPQTPFQVPPPTGMPVPPPRPQR